MEFLRRDLQHLFDDQGIDASAYDDVVDFVDPITKYDSLQGYLFNIQMLRRVFQPTFQLHDIQPAGPLAVATRWTMTMTFTPARLLPTARWWAPQLIFTGTSTYCFNPANGRINRHIDTWDSITDQAYFSKEALGDLLRGLASTSSAPLDLEQPPYTVLRRCASYQVRRYEPFLVAQTLMDSVEGGAAGSAAASISPPAANPSSSGQGGARVTEMQSGQLAVNPAGVGSRAFGRLARYIFGGNAAQQKMAMTTPVFTDTRGVMQFVLGPSSHQELQSVPQPLPGSGVQPAQEQGGVWAVRQFSGVADEARAQQEANALLQSLQSDGVAVEEGAGWKLARYNDPGTLPPFRLNEVLVPVRPPYPVWREGELDELAKVAMQAAQKS